MFRTQLRLQTKDEFLRALHRFFEEEQGQDLIEYALVAALVGLAAVSSFRNLSTKISAAYNTVANDLNSAI